MDLRFECPRCDSLHQKTRPLDSLREHIARVHLDLALFCCPRCKMTFINAFNAHHHIRDECKVQGVLEVKDYTRSLLGMDATYLAELQALENEAISNLFGKTNSSPPSRSESIEYLGVYPAEVKVRYPPPKDEILNHEEPSSEQNDGDMTQKRVQVKMADDHSKKRRMVDEEETAADEEENRHQLATATTRDNFVYPTLNKCYVPSGHRHGNTTGPAVVDSTPVYRQFHNSHPFMAFFPGNNASQMPERPKTNRGTDCVCTSLLPMPKGYRCLSDFGSNFDQLQENVTDICVFRNQTLVKGQWVEGRFSRQTRHGNIHYWCNGKEYSDIRPLHSKCIFQAIGIKEPISNTSTATATIKPPIH